MKWPASAGQLMATASPGNWRATIWQDGEVVREVRRIERKVTRKDVLSLPLAMAGGAAVVLEPPPAP